MPQSNSNTQTPTKNETPQGAAPSEQTPAPNNEDPKTQGANLDDLGYEIPPTEEPEKTDPEKPKVDEPGATGYEEPKEGDPKPATGYEDEPKDPPPAADPKPKEEDPAPAEGDYKIEEVGDLLPAEVTSLTEFVKKHDLSKEVADALVADRKAEVKRIVDSVASQETDKKAEAQRVRKANYEELKADADFGGENFKFNVGQVEKVLTDFMPGLKNKLTDSGAMLPPYVMKDLGKLAKHLYGNESLTQGDPTVPKQKEEENNPLDFYNS
jgi:hypothetical protein